MVWKDITFKWIIKNIYLYLLLGCIVAGIIVKQYYKVAPGLQEISLTSGILRIVFGVLGVVFAVLLLISMTKKGKE